MPRRHKGRPTEQAEPGYLTPQEAAEILGVTDDTVRNMVRREDLPGYVDTRKTGETRYYAEEKAVRALAGLPGSGEVSVDALAARLDTMSAQQEELKLTVRELLEAVRNETPVRNEEPARNETPMTPSDQQESENGSAREEERREWGIAYGRADDPEFLELLGRDVRGKSTTEEHAFLRAPENLQLWRVGLRAILKDLETQNIERKADAEAFRTECMRKGPSGKQEWFDYKAKWDAWKGGAQRFKRSVEISLAEAKRLAQEHQQHDEKERFRQLLVESLDFLNKDEAITYTYTPTRDALREKISSALYKKHE